MAQNKWNIKYYLIYFCLYPLSFLYSYSLKVFVYWLKHFKMIIKTNLCTCCYMPPFILHFAIQNYNSCWPSTFWMLNWSFLAIFFFASFFIWTSIWPYVNVFIRTNQRIKTKMQTKNCWRYLGLLTNEGK